MFGFGKKQVVPLDQGENYTIPAPTPKPFPYDYGCTEPLTTGEAAMILRYLEHSLKVYHHDSMVGFTNGTLKYLRHRLDTNINLNRFAPGEVFIKKEDEDVVQ